MKEPIGKIYGSSRTSSYTGFRKRQLSHHHLLFVEEKPHTFYERSYTEIEEEEKIEDVKIIDGKEYVHTEYKDYLKIDNLENIDYNNILWDYDGGKENIIYYTERLKERSGNLKKTIIDILPHISVTIYHKCAITSPHCYKFQDFNILDSSLSCINKFCKDSTENIANLIYGLLGIYNIEWDCNSHCASQISRNVNQHPNEITYYYGVYGYGYNNAIFSKFTFPQLITMDVTKFKACEGLKSIGEKTDIDFLREFCERQDELRDTLDFRVFERPLTYLEIAKSSQKYLQKISTKQYHKAK